MKKILICDDDKVFLGHIAKVLKRHSYEIFSFSNGDDLIKHLEVNIEADLLLLDVLLPSLAGNDMIERIKEMVPNLKIVMVSGETEVELVVDCMKKGVFNYLAKPFDLNTLVETIKDALSVDGFFNERNTIVGECTIQTIEKDLDKISGKRVSVLLDGESGTGKEYFAKYIYKNSGRKGRFVAVNCPAIPNNLAESELFGHEKGAFTGANDLKIGKFEFAHEGVLFLDEIGDLSLEIQAKLLRCLEERKIVRVGGNIEIEFDVQLISASSKNLKELIEQGKFRLDLFYRLADFEIVIAPLRNRKSEILYFINLFISQFKIELNSKAISFDRCVIQALEQYSWPGNIRELKSVVKRIVLLVDKEKIQMSDIPRQFFPQIMGEKSVSNEIKKEEDLKQLNSNLIKQSLIECNHNVSAVARKLGISRSTIYRKLKDATL